MDLKRKSIEFDLEIEAAQKRRHKNERRRLGVGIILGFLIGLPGLTGVICIGKMLIEKIQ
jgi:hypothetical protein